MHGIVVKGLKDYVVATHGRAAWRAVQERAAVGRRLYAPVARYPDGDGRELAAAARSVTDTDPETLEFEAGRHLAPTLVRVFGAHVLDADTGLDVLADAGPVAREALRRKDVRDAAPPPVAGERLDEDAVVLRYGGDHCNGLRGVAVGLGEYYGESYAVDERACADEGAARCEVVVRRDGDD